MTDITASLALPCGQTLRNRLCKAAMTEGLADGANRATQGHVNLYRRWARGGCGLLLSGNVQIDHRYLERPGNVVIESNPSRDERRALEDWAKAGTQNDTHLWMQLSHAGRQTPDRVIKQPVGPSDKQLFMSGASFGKPIPLTEEQILDIIVRFGHGAKIARATGFTGVQIHAAHGYLISEFLSPDINTRTDAWGGQLENRARLLLESVRCVRKEVGKDFPISVKLNSADFQRGGFEHKDAIQVAKWLYEETIDLLEISGGTYEVPRMVNKEVSTDPSRAEVPRASTIAREAYFFDYAADIRKSFPNPLMVTGGFRSAAAMNAALASKECDVIGLGRPLCGDTDTANKLLSDFNAKAPAYEQQLRFGRGWLGLNSRFQLIRLLNIWGAQGWYYMQLIYMGANRNPDHKLGCFAALLKFDRNERQSAKRYHKYRRQKRAKA